MKKFTKASIVGTALVTILYTVTPTFSAEASGETSKELLKQDISQNELTLNKLALNELTLSEYEKIKFSNYIDLDNELYSINDKAIVELTPVEYNKIKLVVSNTNQLIQEFNNNLTSAEAEEIEILSPQESQSVMAKAAYIEGVTKVTFHWWGIKILISKTDVNKAIWVGITVGGIWIPSRILTSIAAGLGIFGAQPIPGGIYIDQYWVAAVGPIKELFGFDAYGYQ